jgi:hypothetical protein
LREKPGCEKVFAKICVPKEWYLKHKKLLEVVLNARLMARHEEL